MEKLEILLADEDPEIVSIVEHWCHPDGIAYMNTPGYHLVSSFCRTTREHGGSAIYARSNVVVQALDVQAWCVKMHMECSAIKLKFANRKVVVISVYRPPGGDLHIFWDKLAYVLDFCNGNDIFMCGDFNFDYLHNCRTRRAFDDFLLCYNLNVP